MADAAAALDALGYTRRAEPDPDLDQLLTAVRRLSETLAEVQQNAG